jgi:restriction endonuclease S subunit
VQNVDGKREKNPLGEIVDIVNGGTPSAVDSENPHIIDYLYCYIRPYIETIQRLGAGTTFKEVSKNSLSAFLILCFSAGILEKWQIVIQSIFDKQFLIVKPNQRFTSLRDCLLPLLLTDRCR